MAKIGLYIFHPDGYFRARRQVNETDLPQPVNGEARCYIVPATAKIEPIPYRGREDLERVIRAEFEANGRGYLPVGEYVTYYEGTAKDYEGVVATLKKSISAVDNRGVGIERMFEGLAA